MELIIEKTSAVMSNAADETRTNTVRAEVTKAKNGAFEAVRNGQVYDKESGMYLAYFNFGVQEPLNINFATADISADVQNAVIADIQAFIAAARQTTE